MEWQPIETAPKDRTRILICDEDGIINIAEWVNRWDECQVFVKTTKAGDVYKTVREDKGYWQSECVFLPTFWMPLPAPPKNILSPHPEPQTPYLKTE